jgi:hypothetical protein
MRCHGRGRGFESRRPRHSFQALAGRWLPAQLSDQFSPLQLSPFVGWDQAGLPVLRFALWTAELSFLSSCDPSCRLFAQRPTSGSWNFGERAPSTSIFDETSSSACTSSASAVRSTVAAPGLLPLKPIHYVEPIDGLGCVALSLQDSTSARHGRLNVTASCD